MTTAASQETAGWVRADSGRQVDGPPHTCALEHATDLSAPGCGAGAPEALLDRDAVRQAGVGQLDRGSHDPVIG